MGNRTLALRPDDLTPAVVALFRSRVVKTERCWLYRHRPTAREYGRIRAIGRDIYAHRFAWVLHHGLPLDPALEIDHRCRNKACVRPSHLDAVPHTENIARTRGIYARTPKARVTSRGITRWQVRYTTYDGANGARVQRSKTFATLEAARDWIEANRYRPLEEAS